MSNALQTAEPLDGPIDSRPEFLGFGVGLRDHHTAQILVDDPPLDWLEIISENYMIPGGPQLRLLDRLRERYPIVMHGVSLSIASTGEPDDELSARAQGSGGSLAAALDFRSSMLDGRTRQEPA